MNPAEHAARAHRARTPAEIEADMATACRAIGAMAGGARLTGKPIDRAALRNASEGLRRVLVEDATSVAECAQ